MQLFLCNHIYATFLRMEIYFELLSLRPCGLFFLSVFLYARLLLMDNNFLCVDEHCPVKDLTFVVRLSSYQKSIITWHFNTAVTRYMDHF